ncbi:MAG: hypothetical protein HFH68_00180 [Lachnospiraceae bacterium]|nr:hypothetical protein [Lachnospiraceae bacterium]
MFISVYHSTIFKTITDFDGNTTLGTNFGNIKEFFTRQNILSDADINAIRAYNAQIDACVTSQTAFNRTMLNASEAAHVMVEQANGNTVALNNMTRTSKASGLALKGLALAGNMLFAWGITKLISGIHEFTTASESIRESAKETSTSFSGTKPDIESYKTKIQELQDTINGSSSDDDYKNLVPDLLELSNAGTLTPETLKSVENYNTLLEKTWLTAEEAVNYRHARQCYKNYQALYIEIRTGSHPPALICVCK